MHRKILLAVLVLMFGCSSQKSVDDPRVALKMWQDAPAPDPKVCCIEVSRTELSAVVRAGLGRFLGHVSTSPALNGREFVGFRIEAIKNASPKFLSLDLEQGDVVTRVNGMPIERPEQAVAVWAKLPEAKEIVIEHVRQDQPRKAIIRVVDP